MTIACNSAYIQKF